MSETKEPSVPYLNYPRVLVSEEFIKKNNLKLKTQEEISEKLKSVLSDPHFFDFRPEVLISCLPLELAKEYLQEEYLNKVNSGEVKFEYFNTLEAVVQEFLDYMVFAWGKAEDERSLSASRSIQKLSIWLWIINREDLSNTIERDDLYNPYGAPALIEVCNGLGIEIPPSLIEFSKHKC